MFQCNSSENLDCFSFLAGNKTDIFFAPLKTRFIRIIILDNYGGDDIRIQGVGFYGVDMRLVDLLREYGLERSLQTLLANVRFSKLPKINFRLFE